MQPGKIYKHIDNTDVAIRVISCLYQPEAKEYKVRVDWLNVVNPLNIFSCGLTEEIKIKEEDKPNWGEYL